MYLGSAGKRWLTGATEWPFECGLDGMSAVWYLPPDRRISRVAPCTLRHCTCLDPLSVHAGFLDSSPVPGSLRIPQRTRAYARGAPQLPGRTSCRNLERHVVPRIERGGLERRRAEHLPHVLIKPTSVNAVDQQHETGDL